MITINIPFIFNDIIAPLIIIGIGEIIATFMPICFLIKK